MKQNNYLNMPCGSLLQMIPKNEESIIAKPSALLTELSALPPKLSALPTGLSALPKTKIEKLESIKDRIDLLPLRINDKTILEKILIEMCAIHSFKLNELARFIGKSEKHIFRDFIKPLLENKTILYKYPDMINHPEQAYLTKKKKKE